MKYSNLFQDYQPRQGKAWLRSLPSDIRKNFSVIGLMVQRELNLNIHSIGGRANVQRAKRDYRGRFVRKG